jgi:hypothetical protein
VTRIDVEECDWLGLWMTAAIKVEPSGSITTPLM